jgi:hypothetical protein
LLYSTRDAAKEIPFLVILRGHWFQYEFASHAIGGPDLMPEPTDRRKSLRVTIRTVAEISGVSTATFSNVMNDTGKVSLATERRVKAAIQKREMGT